MLANSFGHRLSRLSFCVLIWPTVLLADDADEKPAPSATAISAPAAEQFGAFGWLDHRSAYYNDVFPEPFRVEDTTLDNEIRFDWLHIEGKGGADNQFVAEVQKSVGVATFEIQAGYMINRPETDSDDTQRQDGVGSIDLGGRVPVWQYVSAANGLDNTFGVNLDIGIPTNSRVSKNTEISPGLFDDLCIGDHLTVQSLFSISSLLGAKPAEGRESFEYGVALGYSIEDEQLPIPHVERTTPIFELVGETALDGSTAGHNALTATAGIRLESKSIGDVQPVLGLAYLFPLDKGGRDDMRWGIILSLDFDF